MSSQPEKGGEEEEVTGVTTRARSQQPLIPNLFNSYSNLPKKVKAVPDRNIASDPWEPLPYRIAKANVNNSNSKRGPRLANPEKVSKQIVLLSPQLGEDNVSQKKGRVIKVTKTGNSTTATRKGTVIPCNPA